MRLRIADDVVQTVGALHQLSRVIARQDPDLSKQLRSALDSIGLNSGEGLFARSGSTTVSDDSGMAVASCLAGSSSFVPPYGPSRAPASR